MAMPGIPQARAARCNIAGVLNWEVKSAVLWMLLFILMNRVCIRLGQARQAASVS